MIYQAASRLVGALLCVNAMPTLKLSFTSVRRVSALLFFAVKIIKHVYYSYVNTLVVVN